jgi:predicted glycosyltransferase involved in capsule biosynthesis
LDVQKSKFDLLIPDPDFETLCGLWKDRKEGIDFASSVSPGGCNMITKEAFEKIGGYDERFVGWGFEDTDFMERSQLVNRLSRMNDNDAICWHMHHDQAIRENNPHYLNNLKIYRNNKK